MRTTATALLSATALLAAAAPAPALVSTGTVRVPLRLTVPVTGLDATSANASLSLQIPNSWRRTSRTSRTWITGTRSCRYKVTASLAESVGPLVPAAERLAAELPDTGPRVLDTGTRGSAAWRVTRPLHSGGILLRAASARTVPASGRTLPAGQALWMEIRLTGRQQPGTECHSGTYRETLGPQMGDILATTRQRQYLTAS